MSWESVWWAGWWRFQSPAEIVQGLGQGFNLSVIFSVLCWYWIPREKELIIMKAKGIGGSMYTHLFFYPDNDKLTDYLFDPCRIDYRKLVSTLDFLAWKVHSITVICTDFALFSSKDLFNNRFLWFLASYMALDLARFMKTAPAGSWRPHTLNWLH